MTSCALPRALGAKPDALRQSIRIDESWRTFLGDPSGAEASAFDDAAWKIVNVPHNWEDYQGYTRKSHGNLHGIAWYRRALDFSTVKPGRRYFAQFEGVGSYAEVWLNGKSVGKHAGGRTSFTLDLTDAIQYGAQNTLAVRADHHDKIDDLPYVCGGCWGSPNTEGSQPFGIFRPVHLIETDQISIEPFGLHCWTPEISAARAILRIDAEATNRGKAAQQVVLRSEVLDAEGNVIATAEAPAATLESGETKIIQQTAPAIDNPHLWSLDDPYLHRVRAVLLVGGRPVDSMTERFGFRWISWPVGEAGDGSEESNVRAIDPVRLVERPSPDNNFFSRRTIASADKRSTETLVRVENGGVRVFMPECSAEQAKVRALTLVTNNGDVPRRVIVTSFIVNHDGTKFIYSMEDELQLEPGETQLFDQTSPAIHFPELWSPQNPYLHMIDTRVEALAAGETRREFKDRKLSDRIETTFGIFATEGLANKGDAWIKSSPPAGVKQRDPRFFLNGKPVWINGTAEYEHLLGDDHAFSDEQILARMKQIKAAGFNAFREAHHPHNLRYTELCDKMGLLDWPQIGAHIYFDNEAFRENYRTAMREMVRERRNSPSVVLWGVQNESSLPMVFARELTEIVRQLDPTSPAERKTNTCNGGEGTDWNIPQNWFGTYGNRVIDYAPALLDDKLVGEYGQWRTMGLHQEGDWQETWRNFEGWERVISEELFNYTLETKIRIGEENRDKASGQFQWIFSTHANPGRSEDNSRDALPPNNVGVVNYKGLLTNWGEPVDAYYMYRANFAPAATEPMVYICSHTWPDRWSGPGVKSDIVVFSNCDEVELYNDFGSMSLGVKKRGPRGTHFEWDNVAINCNVLYAEGRMGGRVVAKDLIKLDNLPPAPAAAAAEAGDVDDTTPEPGAQYLYRLNCGGGDYTDVHGNVWRADRDWKPGEYGSESWTKDYPDLESRYASQGKTYDPVSGTRDDALLQTYRFGRDKLKFKFAVPDGEYSVELYFIEPWFGTGGGLDCKGWRIFDVAANGAVVLDDFDIWKEAGHDRALKKVVKAQTAGGVLEITFPEVKSYQGVISAIAVRK